MELLGFLLGAIAIAFVIAKVIFSSKAKTLASKTRRKTRVTTTADSSTCQPQEARHCASSAVSIWITGVGKSG